MGSVGHGKTWVRTPGHTQPYLWSSGGTTVQQTSLQRFLGGVEGL